MVPKYCYEVERHFAIGDNKRDREIKSFETLMAAIGYRDAVLRNPTTRRVVVRMLIDDWTPATAEVGDAPRQPHRYQHNGQHRGSRP